MSKIRKLSQICAALVLAIGLSAVIVLPAQAGNILRFHDDSHIVHHGGHVVRHGWGFVHHDWHQGHH